MNTKTFFNFIDYIKELTLQNRLASDNKFTPCTLFRYRVLGGRFVKTTK